MLLELFAGFILLVFAFIYFTTPAKSLPVFLPGYQAGLSKIHRTHAIASFILGLMAFAFAWFQSGKNQRNNNTNNANIPNNTQ